MGKSYKSLANLFKAAKAKGYHCRPAVGSSESSLFFFKTGFLTVRYNKQDGVWVRQ